jgi:hypothetical protein
VAKTALSLPRTGRTLERAFQFLANRYPDHVRVQFDQNGPTPEDDADYRPLRRGGNDDAIQSSERTEPYFNERSLNHGAIL